MENDEYDLKVWSEGQQGVEQALTLMATSGNQMDGFNSGRVQKEAVVREEQKPDGGWSWIVTLATFCFMYMAAIPSVCFGIIFSRFLLDLGTSTSLTAWIFNLSLVCSGVFSYFTGPLVSEFGWRKVGFVSSLIFGMGLIASAFATSAWYLLFSYSVVVGCNIEILMNISYMVIPHYFNRWRNVTNSIMTSGVSISQMVMPLAITFLQEEYTFRGATIIMGALVFNCCAAAMVLHPVDWHTTRCSSFSSSITERINKDSPITKNPTERSGCLKRIVAKAVSNLKYCKCPSVILTAIVLGMLYVVLYNVFTLVPFAMQQAGFSQRESSFCLAVAGFCNQTCRLLTAFLSCCPGIKLNHVYLFGSFIAAASVMGFSIAGSVMTRAVTLGLCGGGYGLAASLYNLVIVDQLGLAMMNSTLSISSLVMGLLYLVLGPITGVVRDVSGSYVVSLGFCAGCLLSSVLLGLFLPSIIARQQTRTRKTQEQYDMCI